VPPHKIWSAQWPGTQDLCTPAVGHHTLFLGCITLLVFFVFLSQYSHFSSPHCLYLKTPVFCTWLNFFLLTTWLTALQLKMQIKIHMTGKNVNNISTFKFKIQSFNSLGRCAHATCCYTIQHAHTCTMSVHIQENTTYVYEKEKCFSNSSCK